MIFIWKDEGSLGLEEEAGIRPAQAAVLSGSEEVGVSAVFLSVSISSWLLNRW